MHDGLCRVASEHLRRIVLNRDNCLSPRDNWISGEGLVHRVAPHRQSGTAVATNTIRNSQYDETGRGDCTLVVDDGARVLEYSPKRRHYTCDDGEILVGDEGLAWLDHRRQTNEISERKRPRPPPMENMAEPLFFTFRYQ